MPTNSLGASYELTQFTQTTTANELERETAVFATIKREIEWAS